MKTELNSLIKNWFDKAPKWQKDMFNRLSYNCILNSQDVENEYILCKKEYKLVNTSKTSIVSYPFFHEHEKNENKSVTTLKKISNIHGVGKLAPKTPMEFIQNLNIIYGENGSGKSSYINILKNICGSKGAKSIIGNVFDNKPSLPSAEITIMQDDEEKQLLWSENTTNSDNINLMQIYDSDNANIYLTQDSETVFEPEILAIFSEMAKNCDLFNRKLTDERQKIISELVNIPLSLNNAQLIKKYNNISSKKQITELRNLIQWDESLEKKLKDLSYSLSLSNPLEEAKKIKNTISFLSEVKNDILHLHKAYNDEVCISLLQLKSELINRKQLADEDAKKIFSSSKLDGISNESWKMMWNAAREYSEQYAYKNNDFPYIEKEAVCVLCHQPLSDEAINRLKSFEDFIKSKMQTEAQKAQNQYTNAVNNINQIKVKEIEKVKLELRVANVTDDIIIQSMQYYKQISDRKDSLLLETEFEKVLPNLNKIEVDKYYSDIIYALIQKADSLEKVVFEFEQQQQNELELKSKKWLFEHIDQLDKKEKILNLDAAILSTNTKKISILKSALSEELITKDYINRFQKELNSLGACNIQVEIIKSKTIKGKVYHKISLKKSVKKEKITNILSEGELRIVSLAAFLSEVNCNTINMPFVFDDPISSLGVKYEQSVVKRLVELSKYRQVIVFTHRLSLVEGLKSNSKKNGISTNLIEICNQPWGCGDVSNTSLTITNPQKKLNTIKNDYIKKAKNILNDKGYCTDYNDKMHSICTQTRICIEILISEVLLNGVIKRFDPAIHTGNNLKQLSDIKYEECELLDDLMTKYSFTEHSQSLERPNDLFGIDNTEFSIKQIEIDIDKLVNLIKTIKLRRRN